LAITYASFHGARTLHQRSPEKGPTTKGDAVDLLWIILIVILVLALLGFFTRGRW
jgi:flagellar basal body-associated protein FliL